MRLIISLLLVIGFASNVMGQVCTPDANIGNLQQLGLAVGPILPNPIVGSALPSCRRAIVTAVWVNNSDFCFENENDSHFALFRITLPAAFLGATGTIMISASNGNTYWDTPVYQMMSNTYDIPIMGSIPANVAITIIISNIEVQPATPFVFSTVLAQLTTAVTDANPSDNDASVNFFVAQTAGPSITAIVPNCVGDNAGIDLTVSSGTPPYTYSWAGPNGFTAITQDLQNLDDAGVYNVMVSDANGCTDIEMLELDGDNCAPLPIELLNFTATLVDNEKVLLKWVTASEENNAYFSIQRSRDGLKWEEIGQKKGAGNSQQLQYYDFWDYIPYKGINYYRLQQFDYDGVSSFSPIRSASIKGSTQISAVLYPNPGADRFYLQLNGDNNSNYQIDIFNQIGERLPTVISQKDLDHGNYIINAQAYPSGYYQVRITDERGIVIETLPMVKK